MKKLNILFFGCGFIASHLIPQIIPFMEKAVLVDRERVEAENYDNSIYPKGYSGKRKVSALMALLNILSDLTVVPIHRNINRVEELTDFIRKYKIDLMIVSVDNLESRHIARKAATEVGVDTIFIGVTENFGYIDWNEKTYLPDIAERDRIQKILEQVRDVCVRIEFRPLGSLAASLAFTSIFNYISSNKKYSYVFWYEKGDIFIKSILR